VLVMTQKDAVKLRPLLSPDVEAFVLEQTVKFDRGGDALDEALRRAVGG
jgi:tetraacyldisaccharide-1-P 4'-kinase